MTTPYIPLSAADSLEDLVIPSAELVAGTVEEALQSWTRRSPCRNLARSWRNVRRRRPACWSVRSGIVAAREPRPASTRWPSLAAPSTENGCISMLMRSVRASL